jgi:hypothetical protein
MLNGISEPFKELTPVVISFLWGDGWGSFFGVDDY